MKTNSTYSAPELQDNDVKITALEKKTAYRWVDEASPSLSQGIWGLKHLRFA